MRPRRSAVSEIVGVPMLPPPALVPLAERLRELVAGLHRRLAPAPVRVLEGVLALLDPVALGALCRLDVPDRLSGPVPVDELARRLGADVDVVRRLVSYAAGRGWLRLDRCGRVRPTPTTRFLRRDHPGGWRAWVEFGTGPEVLAAAAHLAAHPEAADCFEAANGAMFFDWYLAHPERHRAFDDAMAAGGRLHGLALADAVDWSRTSRVCDVGGGTGALLEVLLERHPHLHGVVLDLAPVVARARLHPRLRTVAGDAFRVGDLPGDCDTYLFVNVLHDWDDQRAADLLRHVRQSGPPGARTIVVEGEAGRRRPHGIAARTDVLMLVLAPGGRERTTAEFARLAEEAGLRLRRTVPLASGDRAHILG